MSTINPWDVEPDREEWRHSSGLPCLAKRGPFGAWCGYVAVPPDHPFHGTDYTELEVYVDVHGGLTYAAPCHGEEGVGICHVPKPGEPADVWWFGFDCAHYDDFAPGLPDFGPHYGTYRCLAYVRSEVDRLAEQLAACR